MFIHKETPGLAILQKCVQIRDFCNTLPEKCANGPYNGSLRKSILKSGYPERTVSVVFLKV